MAGVSDTHRDHLFVKFCRISLKHQSRDISEKSDFFLIKVLFGEISTFIENKSLIPKVSCVLLESLNIDLKKQQLLLPYHGD